MNQNILNEYVIKETIGKGTFSKVKLGIIKSTGEKVAIKILEKRKIKNKTDQIRVERELNILRKINHINIVRIIQTKEDQDNIYIIMEFIDYDLFLHIVNNKRLDEKESSLYFFQLITGLEYIHFLNIVHRDLKPENLLLTKKRILKIIDFGLSNYFTGDELLLTPCGSPSYTPPEMIKGYKYNGFAVDIWSTGIILYGMLCGYLPFEERDNKALFKKIIKCKVNYPKYISNNAQNLLKKILVANPDKRITINEIKKHPFFLEGKEVFYKRYPDYIEKIENGLINPINNINNTNDTSPNDNNPKNNNNENGKTLGTKMNYKYGYNKKDKSSSAFKSRKHNPNYYILKRILKGSRENFLEEDNKNINTEKKENQKENKDDEERENLNEEEEEMNKEKESKENSQEQIIQKISNNIRKYNKRPIYTEQEDKNKFYKQKYLKTSVDSLDYENKKNNDLKSSFNNFTINTNPEIDKYREYQDSPKEDKNDQYIINDKNKKKYNKRNINYDYSFTKEYFNHGKLNTQQNTVADEERSTSSLNHSLYKTNNYSYRLNDLKRYHKNNYSINSKYESKFGNFDSFHSNKNSSLQMKSYMLNNSKNESSIKKRKRKNTDNKINSPSSPNYSGLSKKIISINHLCNLIQNKLDKRTNEQNDLKYQSSAQNLENPKLNMSSNIKKNKKKNHKSEQHRKKKTNKIIKNKNNNCNIKYSTSYLQKRLKSIKNSNNNSKVNLKDLKNCSSRKNNIEPINNNNNSMSQKLKKIKKNVVTDLNKNQKMKIKISKNDKYNIKEIIKRRGLNKINIK